MTNVKEIKKGDQFWCLGQGIATPTLGTVIALTSNPSKQIGLEFQEAVGVHSCDNRGREGYCLWVTPNDILTQDEYTAKQEADAATNAALASEDIDVLTLP